MSAQETSYDIKSRKKDFEQHAKKIYTEIRELDPNLSTKRAIWELFQNALDLSQKNDTVIKIHKQNGTLRFEHNGKPFDEDSLASLIKQTSNKTFGDNTEQIGQYGTGFLTTHVYGKKFSIFGSIETGDNGIKELVNFEIDRDGEIDDLIEKIKGQDDRARKICSGTEFSIELDKETTSFLYDSSNAENYVEEMTKYIPDVLPYVFVFNEKLQRVEIKTNEKETIFSRSISEKQNNLLLCIDNLPFNLSYISNYEYDIKIILPDNVDNLSSFPKIFLYYPLIGTEDIGFNFIINSKYFRPNKERDSIFLEAKNNELEADVSLNKVILKKSFELVKQHISTNSEVDILPFYNIQFTGGGFLDSLKEDFISFCKSLERIKLYDGKLTSLEEIHFFDEEILKHDSDKLQSIYNVAKQFYKLPHFEDYIYLCKQVNSWSIFEFNKVGFTDILSKIETETECLYERITDRESYLETIKLLSNNITILNEHKVIPNIHKTLMRYEELRRWGKIEKDLILVMDNLNPEVSSRYLLDEFYCVDNIQKYTRENFKDDINKFCTSFFNKIDGNEDGDIGADETYHLVKWLTYFIALNKTTKINTDLSNFFINYYKLNTNGSQIDSPTSILQYESPIKLVARLFIMDIKRRNIPIKEILNELREFVSVLFESHEFKKHLLDKLDCYPTQSYKLRSAKDLKIDKIKDKDFLVKYNEITGNDIFGDLVDPVFEKYLQHENTIDYYTLGREIEENLLGGKELYKNALEESAKLEEDTKQDISLLKRLLNLIDYISKDNSKWGGWLPKLNKEREGILLEKFKDDKTRNSLFAILSKEETVIHLLGKLAEVNDLESLIEKGNQKLQEEERQKQHKGYIKDIGLKIQSLIDGQLDKDLAETIELLSSDKLEKKEEQNGQDFIIYKNCQPVFYIEVKSKWDENGRFLLSKNQTERCAQQKDNYAVISVNVDRYRKEKEPGTENIEFNKISDYVRVNTELGEVFEKVLAQNFILDDEASPKLVEYGGHIPQKIIDGEGMRFDEFMAFLKDFLMK